MKLSIVLVLAILAAVPMGCTTVCDQVEASVPQVNARLADVQRAIAEVEKSGVREKLSGDARVQFDAAMAKIRDGYTLAVQSNALAAETCASSRNYLDMIVQGWGVVRGFLSLVGGEGTMGVVDPIVWAEAQ